jgi:hypothetical protein
MPISDKDMPKINTAKRRRMLNGQGNKENKEMQST